MCLDCPIEDCFLTSFQDDPTRSAPAPPSSNVLATGVPGTNSISIKALGIDEGSDLGKIIRDADTNGDGVLEMPEIIAVFQKLSQKNAQIRIMTQMFTIQFVLLLLFALVSFGLTWAVVINNTNPVNRGVMLDRASGEPIQVVQSIAKGLRASLIVKYRHLH